MGWNEVWAASIEAQGPVLVREVAELSGVTRRAVRDRATREGWWRPYPSVVAVPGTPRDGRARALAAVLQARGATGDPARDVAAATGESALAVLGLRRSFPAATTVVVPTSRAPIPRPALAVVRSTFLRPDTVREQDGIPVVTGAHLVRDLAAGRSRADLRDVVVDLAAQGSVDLARLEAGVAAFGRFPGCGVVRAVLADLDAAGRCDSPFEYRLRARLGAEGIPLDRGQVSVPGTRIHLDLGIAAIRFGIEADSLRYHSSRADLERDAARTNAVLASATGWAVLRATWSTLDVGWQAFVAQVREVISAQSRQHLGVPWPPPAVVR